MSASTPLAQALNALHQHLLADKQAPAIAKAKWYQTRPYVNSAASHISITAAWDFGENQHKALKDALQAWDAAL